MSSQPVALITGASSGIGAATAQTFANAGYRVYGTSRRHLPDTDYATMRVLDVTDAASIHTCVESILDETGRIDVVINNAGTAHVSALEESDIDNELVPIIDVNLIGTMRVIQAVLPHMRQRRTGHIICIGSLAGRVGIPVSTAYTASKAGVVGMCSSLRIECETFGVRVAVVEPGAVITNFANHLTLPETPLSYYDEMREEMRLMGTHSTQELGYDPQETAALILRVAQTKNPRLQYLSGTDARLMAFLKWLLPDRWFMVVVQKMFDMTLKRMHSA